MNNVTIELVIKCISVFIFRVIVSVMTFEGEDCRLAEVGKLADHTGGRVREHVWPIGTDLWSAATKWMRQSLMEIEVCFYRITPLEYDLVESNNINYTRSAWLQS